MRISYSEVETFTVCRQRHHFNYTEKIVSREQKPAPLIGIAGHLGLQNMLLKNDWRKAINDWREKETGIVEGEIVEPTYITDVNNAANTALEVLERYERKYGDQFKPAINPQGEPMVEKFFEVQLPLYVKNDDGMEPVFLIGYFDAIVEDIDGSLYLLEHKFPRNFRDEKNLELDSQVGIYQWAANQLGFPVIGTIFNQIKSTPLELPGILKSGKVSKDKSVNCDWETYKQFVIAQNQSVEDYADMEEPLSLKEFFRRSFIFRTPRQIEIFADHFIRRVKEMIRPDNEVFMEPQKFNCGWCEYYRLCQEIERGNPIDGIISDFYQTKGKREAA